MHKGTESKQTKTRGATKKINKSYSLLHKSVSELENIKLIESEWDSSGARKRRVLTLTETAKILIILLLDSGQMELDASQSEKEIGIEKFLKKHQDFFIFAPFLKQLKEIVGEKALFENLIQTANKLICGTYINFKIRDLNLSFKAYYYPFSNGIFTHDHEINLDGKQRRAEISKIIETNSNLRDAYIASLAIHDIRNLSKRGAKEDPGKLLSERELTFFEKKKPYENQLFTTTRLKKYFPEHADAKTMFTGLLLFKILWENKPENHKPKSEIEHHPKFQVDWNGIMIG